MTTTNIIFLCIFTLLIAVFAALCCIFWKARFLVSKVYDLEEKTTANGLILDRMLKKITVLNQQSDYNKTVILKRIDKMGEIATSEDKGTLFKKRDKNGRFTKKEEIKKHEKDNV